MREGAKDKVLKPLMKKPLVAGLTELRGNPSSRSAKLRGAEKL
jgi:16S rRNA C1402 N4-methylase RsmH